MKALIVCDTRFKIVLGQYFFLYVKSKHVKRCCCCACRGSVGEVVVTRCKSELQEELEALDKLDILTMNSEPTKPQAVKTDVNSRPQSQPQNDYNQDSEDASDDDNNDAYGNNEILHENEPTSVGVPLAGSDKSEVRTTVTA